MRRRAAITWRIPSIHARGYRLPAGTFALKDPRSIYDSQVHHLWKPSIWFDAEKRARARLRPAAQDVLRLNPDATDELVEAQVQSFFVPYWLVRMALFAPVDYATMSREYTEGRISIDLTFSFSGTDHHALKYLHFLSPTTEILNNSVTSSQPVEGFVYVPFSQAPPLDYRRFFEDITEEKDLIISRNLKLRRSSLQFRMAARPVLEPILLAEYRYQKDHITVASCLRLGRESIRVYSKGSWTHDASVVGPSQTSFSIAWSGSDPKGVDYGGLEAALQSKASAWLNAASTAHSRPLPTTPELWSGPTASFEGFNSIRSWREAKLDLWQQGYELAGGHS